MNDIILLTSAKLTCPCNMLQSSNLFARNDTGVVIDSKPHLSRMCKTCFLFAALAVRVYTGRFTFPFYTPTKPLTQLHVLFPILDIYNKM